MAIKKNSAAEDITAADIKDEVQREVRKQSARNRKPLKMGAAIAGGVVALGAAFGIGLVAGHAAPGFPGGGDFAAGQGQQGGPDGDRDGDHRGGGRHGDRDGDGFGGQQGGGLQAPGQTDGTAPNGTAPAPNGSAPAPGGSNTQAP